MQDICFKHNFNLFFTMKRGIFLLLAIVSVAGIIAISGITNSVFGQSGTLNGHEYVDLGLPSGTKWATCNVGASNPREYGDYFAWGETKPRSSYSEDNYMFFSDPAVLPASADAATANWGSGWRMPTKAEFEELKDKCTWTWLSNGYKVVGPNGNGIFLPAAGRRYDSELDYAGSYGLYWSSSLRTDYTGSAWDLDFCSDDYGMSRYYRGYGCTVRPVCVSQN